MKFGLQLACIWLHWVCLVAGLVMASETTNEETNAWTITQTTTALLSQTDVEKEDPSPMISTGDTSIVGSGANFDDEDEDYELDDDDGVVRSVAKTWGADWMEDDANFDDSIDSLVFHFVIFYLKDVRDYRGNKFDSTSSTYFLFIRGGLSEKPEVQNDLDKFQDKLKLYHKNPPAIEVVEDLETIASRSGYSLEHVQSHFRMTDAFVELEKSFLALDPAFSSARGPMDLKPDGRFNEYMIGLNEGMFLGPRAEKALWTFQTTY